MADSASELAAMSLKVKVNVAILLDRSSVIGDYYPAVVNDAERWINESPVVLGGLIANINVFEGLGYNSNDHNMRKVGFMKFIATADMIKEYGTDGVIPAETIGWIQQSSLSQGAELTIKFSMLKKGSSQIQPWTFWDHGVFVAVLDLAHSSSPDEQSKMRKSLSDAEPMARLHLVSTKLAALRSCAKDLDAAMLMVDPSTLIDAPGAFRELEANIDLLMAREKVYIQDSFGPLL